MPELFDVRLADHTTLRVGGRAARFIQADTDAEILATVQQADAAGMPVLILSGGSNIVAPDAGFDGVVVKIATQGIDVEHESDCGGVLVQVAAGQDWDAFVDYACGRGWSGIEALSGIPGKVGSTPIQNVGAYGTDVSATIARVRTWDRDEQRQRTFTAAECEFGYRTSIFKRSNGRYVVLSVTFQLLTSDVSAPVRYAELATELGVDLEARAPLADVRAAVLTVRRRKAMVVDEADHDTWSCGSFFTNPILTSAQASRLPADAPQFPQPDGTVKTSAAWLIQQAGFPKGYGNGPVTLSTKHVLALTNRGEGTSAQVRALADEIIAGVRARWGVTLEPEARFV